MTVSETIKKSIRERVDEYTQKRMEFKTFEADLVGELESILAAEIAGLSKRLPTGWSMQDFRIHICEDTKRPLYLDIDVPSKPTGQVTERELVQLNQMYERDFKRIEEEYGIRVWQFQYGASM